MNYYAGIDLHKYYSYIVVKDVHGCQVKKGKVLNCREALEIFFKNLPQADIYTVIEATSNYYWLYEILTDLGCKVKLAHPKKTKAIASAKVKNDKIDANMLADLLRADLIPESYIPEQKIRYLRELSRHRIRIVRNRTYLKNQLAAILMKLNLNYPHKVLFTERGTKWFKEQKIPDVFALQRDELLLHIEFLDKQINDLDRKIKSTAISCPAISRLLNIHGIGYFSSLLILAEIGDINRFPSAKKLASFAGLTPSLDESANHRRLGHITREGSPYLRWILCEISKHFIRYHAPLKDFYWHLRKLKGHGKANIAVARKIIMGLYFVLKYDVDFDPRMKLRHSF